MARNNRVDVSTANEDPVRITNEDSKGSNEQRGYIRYIGLSQVRKITKDDLSGVGFSGNDLVDLSWSQSNNWLVARSDIPDGVYERAIVPDAELIMVDPKDDGA